MFTSPRWIALFLATIITLVTITFLSFVPEVEGTMMFVAGTSCFIGAFFFTFYTIDILVFREVNQIYQTIRQLKIQDFGISRKSLIRSVNPLKKLNREISNYMTKKQEEIDELKRMEQFRREFLADVSHELKTPIFAAQGFIHTLMDGAKDDPMVANRFLKKAAKSLDGLDALVRDLVVLTQVESGDLKMVLEEVDLEQIVQDIFEQLEDKADKRGTKLKIKCKPGIHTLVWADRQRITQVMTNLIDNAIKYGKDQGKILVELEDDKKHLQVSVEDDGPGIPQEHLGRVFERFYRIDKSRSRETGGTGLGLAIVKHILNAHESQITVTSRQDKGARFSFRLQKAEK
ncbi:MAG: sensor histidine kinase [Spirosomataceae bacterium]